MAEPLFNPKGSYPPTIAQIGSFLLSSACVYLFYNLQQNSGSFSKLMQDLCARFLIKEIAEVKIIWQPRRHKSVLIRRENVVFCMTFHNYRHY